jgi:hypothetical protein
MGTFPGPAHGSNMSASSSEQEHNKHRLDAANAGRINVGGSVDVLTSLTMERSTTTGIVASIG